MRYIDGFNHFFPKRLWDKMLAPGAPPGYRRAHARHSRHLRPRRAEALVDMFKDKNYTQVISLGMPPLEALGTPEVTMNSPSSATTAWPSSAPSTPTISSAGSPRCR